MLSLRPAIFLDRDGVINVDHGYPHKPEDFAFMPDAETAIKHAHHQKLPIFIVTNQGGIGRGFFSIEDMQNFHQHLQMMTQSIGGKIADIAYCPHHPLAVTEHLKTPCRCRKPEPGLLFDLAEKWQLDLRRSVMVGDRSSDVEAGQRAGCHSYLFDAGDLHALAQHIITTHFQSGGR